jgi:hypothetical protein
MPFAHPIDVIPQKDSDGGDTAGNRARGFLRPGLILQVGAKIVGVGAEERLFSGAEISADVLQVAAVGSERIIGKPALGCEVKKKLAENRIGGGWIRRRGRAGIFRRQIYGERFC